MCLIVAEVMITAELRWFYSGSVPMAVKNWFIATRDHTVMPGEVREDRYLQLSGCDSLNLKLRHGNLELKLRLRQFSNLQVGDRWVGQVEVWQKWNLEDFPGHLNLGDSDLEGAWISVRKVRSQQQYQTFLDQPPQAVKSLLDSELIC